MMRRLFLILGVLALTFSLVGQVEADPITLFNTGVDGTGTPLLQGNNELHYSIISGPITGTPKVLTSFGGFPIPPWVGDNGTSAWIAPDLTDNHPPGTYGYRLMFDLTGLDPSTAVINGQWSTDNSGTMFLNSVDTTNTVIGFMTFTPFSIISGFVAGINIMDFNVLNFSDGTNNPSGLRVEMTGTANAVSGSAPIPEPSTLLLLASGLAGLAAWRRKKVA